MSLFKNKYIGIALLFGMFFCFNVFAEVDYLDEDSGYSVKFPDNWEVKYDVMGTDVIALSPPETEEDLFRENVNVIHTKLTNPITEEEFNRINMISLEKLLTDYDLEQQEEVAVDGVKAKRLIYTHRMGVVNAKVLQYLILIGQEAYVVTFTAEPRKFDQYKDLFAQIMSTFKLPKQPEVIAPEAIVK